MTSHRFPKNVRLRKQVEFDAVYRNKTYAADSTLVIQANASEPDGFRLGLSVSRKVGNAVVRNRWKRVIRETFRQLRAEMEREILSDSVPGLDIVVRPRKGATCDYARICKGLPKLLHRIVRKIEKQAQLNSGDPLLISDTRNTK